MRKTRLVILPTKCLHQMGFLLLFLSCPVIGDWGRIRPDTETSQKAIQIDKEGTCGLLRDRSEGLFSFVNKDGLKQCRLGEYEVHDSDSQLPAPEERTAHVRRVNTMERKIENKERNARGSMQRRVVTERADVRRERQGERDVRRTSRRDSRTVQGSEIRSRSLERDARVRNEGIARSRSLSRLDNEERRMSRQRSVERVEARSLNTRRDANDRRLSSARRMNDDRRVEQQQRRVNRDVQNDRRENERAIRSQRRDVRRERSERSMERRELRRETTENSLRRSNQRENERTTRRTTAVERRETTRRDESSTERRQVQTRRENERMSRSTERLSLARRELERQTQRRDTRRVENQQERRTGNENRDTRRTRSLEVRRNTLRLDDKPITRRSRSVDSRRVIETRRSFLGTADEQRNAREQRRINPVTSKGPDGIRQVRTNLEPQHKTSDEYQTEGTYGSLGGLMEWIGLNTFEVGNLATNCAIGAVAYFLTFRRLKIA